MKGLLADAGLKCMDFEGIAWGPARGLHLSEDLSLNYLVAAVPRNPFRHAERVSASIRQFAAHMKNAP
jgi:hypothetical protein